MTVRFSVSLILICQGQFDFDFIYTAIEGPIESIALDEARSLLAIAGLGRVVVLRLCYSTHRGMCLSTAVL